MNPSGPRPIPGADREPCTLWTGGILHADRDNELKNEFIEGEIPVSDYAEGAAERLQGGFLHEISLLGPLTYKKSPYKNTGRSKKIEIKRSLQDNQIPCQSKIDFKGLYSRF